MKRAVLAAAALVLAALLLPAQFGGIINRAKQKVDQATKKAEPVTKRAERAVDTYADWTKEQEEEIGQIAAAKMIAMFGLVDAPGGTRYVNLVGQAVAQFAPRPVSYRFAILDSDIVEAFALPGGFIFVTRGALEGMRDEAELAGALGHEVFHISERHLERELRAKKGASWAKEEVQSKTGGFTRDALNRFADDVVKGLVDSPLSRDKEQAADEQGTQLAIQSGYAADGLLRFLRTMMETQEKPENKLRFGQWLSTHPPFPDRIGYLTPIAEAAPKGGKTLEARFAASLR